MLARLVRHKNEQERLATSVPHWGEGSALCAKGRALREARWLDEPLQKYRLSESKAPRSTRYPQSREVERTECDGPLLYKGIDADAQSGLLGNGG